jgi:hypothetical protein
LSMQPSEGNVVQKHKCAHFIRFVPVNTHARNQLCLARDVPLMAVTPFLRTLLRPFPLTTSDSKFRVLHTAL